jgi:hypothetical protein
MRQAKDKRRKLLMIILTAVGVAGSVWCYFSHICMVGHMHHPPYPLWHHALDIGWGAAWLSCATLSLFVEGRRWKFLGGALLLLLVYRFALGSLGGLLPLPI